MRVLISILAGFFFGVLLVGTGLEWLLTETSGECSTDCASWQDWVVVPITLGGWVFFSIVTYLLWDRVKPREAPSAYEERIQHVRRGGR